MFKQSVRLPAGEVKESRIKTEKMGVLLLNMLFVSITKPGTAWNPSQPVGSDAGTTTRARATKPGCVSLLRRESDQQTNLLY